MDDIFGFLDHHQLVFAQSAGKRTPQFAHQGAAVGANAAGLALAVAYGALTRWREPQGPVLVVLFLAGGIGAMLPADGPRDP
jgi:hypothetical protein